MLGHGWQRGDPRPQDARSEINRLIVAVKPTLARFLTREVLRNHLTDQGICWIVRATDRVKYVLLGQNVAQCVDHIRHQIDADHIIQPKDPSFGNTHRAAHQSICVFDAESLFEGLIHAHLERKYPHAIS